MREVFLEQMNVDLMIEHAHVVNSNIMHFWMSDASLGVPPILLLHYVLLTNPTRST